MEHHPTFLVLPLAPYSPDLYTSATVGCGSGAWCESGEVLLLGGDGSSTELSQDSTALSTDGSAGPNWPADSTVLSQLSDRGSANTGKTNTVVCSMCFDLNHVKNLQ